MRDLNERKNIKPPLDHCATKTSSLKPKAFLLEIDFPLLRTIPFSSEDVLKDDGQRRIEEPRGKDGKRWRVMIIY